ncbi:MAG: cytochrome P450, partial [Pseudomonadota bacterium]
VYCRQIIDEAMRLFPPAAIISREAVADDQLLGREVKAGDTVILPVYTLHRHEHFWEDPMAFDPDNFAPEKVKERNRFLYLPFGAGPRICIGMSFAMMEAQIILATLLARYRFEPKAGPAPEPVMTITLRPKGGMPLRFRKR